MSSPDTSAGSIAGRRLVALLAAACSAGTPSVDPCLAAGADAPSTCVSPTREPAYYVAQSNVYFDSMDERAEPGVFPAYAEQAIRWEWPPWLKLTGFRRDVLEGGDTLLRAYPSIVEDRDCRAFDTQPFGRCRVTFVYDARPDAPCPIYEEFTFDDEGELTFVEAWSDLPGLRPMADDDPWASADGVARLSSRVPGLGAPGGEIDLDGAAMRAAAASDPDVADLVTRAHDFFGAWVAEQAAVGDDAWRIGCGG